MKDREKQNKTEQSRFPGKGRMNKMQTVAKGSLCGYEKDNSCYPEDRREGHPYRKAYSLRSENWREFLSNGFSFPMSGETEGR